MTKEDPLYKPAPANTNPFADNAQMSTGRKLVASETERQVMFEVSKTLPPYRQSLEANKEHLASRQLSTVKQSYSLPENNGMVQRAVALFDSQISSSVSSRNMTISSMDTLLNSDYASGESSMEGSFTEHQFARRSSKQRNLECAMLFCGLDLIQMHRASSSDWSDTQISSVDLESEFQDDLEDVLRQSKRNCDDTGVLSPTQDSAFGDFESDLGFSAEQADASTCRYLHPTLVEKRKQLRRVESRQKEKLEQLQFKLEQLKLSAKRNSKKSRKKFASIS